ncbi:MAG TPA: hypothetical protein DEH78_28095, partial [Solibacterales bacterium]|nr:hypothetical protein [Bryobacterales bacterium]
MRAAGRASHSRLRSVKSGILRAASGVASDTLERALMTRERKIYWVKTATILCLIPVLVYAFGSGPPPRRTGAPGDRTCLDSGCHVGTSIPDSGAIALSSSIGDLSYTPGGARQRWTVRITDAQARRFGFQLTTRLASNETSGQAGDLNPADTATQVICENDQPKPAAGCPSSAPVQFVEHFQFPRTDGTFTFDWTPPATNVGDVRVYVAANGSVAGVGNSRIHLRNFTIRPATSVPPSPAIRAEQSVLQAFDDRARISPGTYVQVFGSNFAQNGANGRLWEGRDFNGNSAPTNLDGWGVTFNDIPGFVYFVRGGVSGAPDQINVQVPNIATTGNVNVVVTGPGGLRSNAATLPAAAVSPALLAPAGFR